MAPIWRLVAILGYPAHLIDRVARSALPFLPARFPSVLPVVALFGFVALQWWQTAAATDAQRRGPEPASVAAIVAGTDWDWVTFDALVSGPHADSSVYADEDDGPHYYRILNEAHDREGRRLGEDAPPGLLQLPEADGIPRWFYVLRDPQDPTAAVVARSARDADAMR
ncbi:MAG: hypothetical protein H0V04_04815, partial [Chloroflexi bacterium]|nr:hypothetical protein [Chloroflexota bacterium]